MVQKEIYRKQKKITDQWGYMWNSKFTAKDLGIKKEEKNGKNKKNENN